MKKKQICLMSHIFENKKQIIGSCKNCSKIEYLVKEV